jgi:hypothetical protein
MKITERRLRQIVKSIIKEADISSQKKTINGVTKETHGYYFSYLFPGASEKDIISFLVNQCGLNIQQAEDMFFNTLRMTVVGGKHDGYDGPFFGGMNWSDFSTVSQKEDPTALPRRDLFSSKVRPVLNSGGGPVAYASAGAGPNNPGGPGGDNQNRTNPSGGPGGQIKGLNPPRPKPVAKKSKRKREAHGYIMSYDEAMDFIREMILDESDYVYFRSVLKGSHNAFREPRNPKYIFNIYVDESGEMSLGCWVYNKKDALLNARTSAELYPTITGPSTTGQFKCSNHMSLTDLFIDFRDNYRYGFPKSFI